jgi:hypothetical protein
MDWEQIFSDSLNYNGVKRFETVSLSADDPTGIWVCIFRETQYETFIAENWEHLGIVEPKKLPVRYFFELDREQYEPTPLSLQSWLEQNIYSEFRKRLKQTKRQSTGRTGKFQISSVFSNTYSMTTNGLTRRGSATRVFLIPAEHHDYSSYIRTFDLKDQKHQVCLEFEWSRIHNQWVPINVLSALERNDGVARRTERIYHEVAGGPIVVNISIQTEFFSPTDSPHFRSSVKQGNEQTIYQAWQSLKKISPEIQQCEITVPDPYEDKEMRYWSDRIRYEFEKEWLFEPD